VSASTRVSTAVLAASALCAASWTTVDARPTFELGIRGGVGLTSVGGGGLTTRQPLYEDLGGGNYLQGEYTFGLGHMKLGFAGGAYVVGRVNDRFGIRLEALCSVKGTQGDNSGVVGIYDSSNTLLTTLDLTGKNTLTLVYFEVPILAVMYLPVDPTGSFEVFAGPSFGFKSKAAIEQVITLSREGASATSSVTSDIGSDVADTEFGGVLGLGYSHRTRSVILSVDARWTQGFSEIDNTGGPDWKNNAIGLSVGIGVPLGGAK
jgi:outer membrane protein with beta-barrel domain